jgi:two-component system, cell cycle sensor histidine kinase and response regulator CckA
LLTKQLLAFSRQQMLAPKVFSLNDTVRNMDQLLRRLLGEDIELETLCRARKSCIRADSGQIEQVMMNLAVNARDAMPRGGKLTIETADVTLGPEYTSEHFDVAPGNYVLLAVSDTGVGMNSATRERIFEPFFTTKDQGKGTGLGLSTVYGIVSQSGGHIFVYSEPGIGTTFKVYMPQVDATTESGIMQRPQLAVGGGETVMVVEDEQGVRDLVKHILARGGYSVLTAKSAEEAVQACAEKDGEIALLLTDVVLAKGSGREVAEKLSAMRPKMRVLFMSGYTDDAIVRHGVLDANTAFLQKPFTPDRLLSKVREVLDSNAAMAASTHS